VHKDLLLGLDLGTTRCKALLLDASGAEVAVAVAPTPFVASDGRIEAPADRLILAATPVVASLGAMRDRVAAVAIAGMAECGAPLNAAGEVLAPVISWHDPRGSDVAEHLAHQFGDSLGLRTGQRPRSVSSVAKLGWQVAHGVAGVDRWLGVPELVLRDLTGVEATEHSFASRTGCWNVVERVWLDEVAEAAGFSVAVFAPIRDAGSAMGVVGRVAAERWGLPPGIPVTLAGHDHLVGAAGVGARPGDLVNSVGTAETVLGLTESVPDMARALELRTPVSVAPGGRAWVVLAGAARAGVVLDAAAVLLGHPIQKLDTMAEGAEGAACVDGTAFLRDIQAGGTPTPPDGTPGAVWLGLLHALAKRTAETAGRVGQLVPAARMLVIGGGSQSRPWLRAKAKVVRLPILRPRTNQAVARGAALFAGQAAGWWPSPDADAAPRLGADPA
jgi:xylulokinase